MYKIVFSKVLAGKGQVSKITFTRLKKANILLGAFMNLFNRTSLDTKTANSLVTFKQRLRLELLGGGQEFCVLSPFVQFN